MAIYYLRMRPVSVRLGIAAAAAVVLSACGARIGERSEAIASGAGEAPDVSDIVDSEASVVAETTPTISGPTITVSAMDDFSPEVVTGLRIGDPIPNGNPAPGIDADGVFRLELVPIWVPAVLEDLVVGYLKKDDLFGFGDDPTSPAQNYVPVYDNNGSQIGIMGPTGVTIFNA